MQIQYEVKNDETLLIYHSENIISTMTRNMFSLGMSLNEVASIVSG